MAAPQPRIAAAGDLVRRMASAETDVTMTVTGQPRPLSAAVELCGYRIVQEALTNAGRYTPGSQVQVGIAYRDDAVHITVRDDGAGRAAACGTPVPAAAVPAVTARAATAAATGSGDEPAFGRHGAVSGFGLAGLRERVAMLGGQFEAGPDEAGGSASVRCCLPRLTASGARS